MAVLKAQLCLEYHQKQLFMLSVKKTFTYKYLSRVDNKNFESKCEKVSKVYVY